jgi:hypothetical protein
MSHVPDDRNAFARVPREQDAGATLDAKRDPTMMKSACCEEGSVCIPVPKIACHRHREGTCGMAPSRKRLLAKHVMDTGTIMDMGRRTGEDESPREFQFGCCR